MKIENKYYGSDDAAVQELYTYVERIEKSYRTLLLLNGILIVMLATLLLTGAARPEDKKSKLIQTRALEVIDETGMCRIRMGISDDTSPELVLYDSNGVGRIRLLIHEDQIPRLAFFDDWGRLRELLGVSPDGAAVKLFDQEGNMRSIMGLYQDGSTGFSVLDTDGIVRGGIVSDPSGNASFSIFDKFKNTLFSVP